MEPNRAKYQEVIGHIAENHQPMKNLFDTMNDNMVKLTGAAFAVAFERQIFFQSFIQSGLLSVVEVWELQDAAKSPADLDTLRQLLNKINNNYIKIAEEKQS